ncbi:hypothetical protein BC936DRAFT_147543 [Jimgerdemannia flammicorona]|uniref:Acyl-CoA N-acyltransferase n=1 Tax=Jimgerdemannia flammicorona TaxID=994334 RepID=A0A433DLF1_9FUNG|nr:hypothetical protein BC936DRAFT_147543 [Jimgerdemannia flammicorona]
MPSPPPYQLRSGTEQDLPAILEIFNHEVRTTTSLYLQDPVTLANRKAWFDGLRDGGYPFIVATAREGEGGEEEEELLGPRSELIVALYLNIPVAAQWRSPSTSIATTAAAASGTCSRARLSGLEKSVGTTPSSVTRPSQFFTASEPILSIITPLTISLRPAAGICTENSASLSLYKSHGFREVGVFRESGFKSGRWMSTAFYQLML